MEKFRQIASFRFQTVLKRRELGSEICRKERKGFSDALTAKIMISLWPLDCCETLIVMGYYALLNLGIGSMQTETIRRAYYM
eukprot:scaffold157827_cov23-Prasinocladus_malaysianus.AAC.1